MIKIIRVYDLTIEVRDLLGFAASGTEVKLYTDEEALASGATDAQGTPCGRVPDRILSHHTCATLSVGC